MPHTNGRSEMAILNSFAIGDFSNTLVSLLAAFVLGTLIGAERQYRQRSGGLGTNVLVAVGSATFVDIGMHLNGTAGATQVVAYVVSGGRISRRGRDYERRQERLGPQHRSYVMVFCGGWSLLRSQLSLRSDCFDGLCARRKHAIAPIEQRDQ